MATAARRVQGGRCLRWWPTESGNRGAPLLPWPVPEGNEVPGGLVLPGLQVSVTEGFVAAEQSGSGCSSAAGGWLVGGGWCPFPQTPTFPPGISHCCHSSALMGQEGRRAVSSSSCAASVFTICFILPFKIQFGQFH